MFKKKNAPASSSLSEAGTQIPQVQSTGDQNDTPVLKTGGFQAKNTAKKQAEKDNERRNTEATEKSQAKVQKKTGKASSKSLKTRIAAMKVPDATKQVIPYKEVFKNGIIKSEGNVYTKCYELTDAAFDFENEQGKKEARMAYTALFDSFQPDVRPQIVLFVEKGTDADPSALTNIRKFLVVGISAENIQVAANVFSRVDDGLYPLLRDINGTDTAQMTMVDRLQLLHEIYNPGLVSPFYKKMELGNEQLESFQIQRMTDYKLTTKDLIAPPDLKFQDDYFLMDGRFGRVITLRRIPTVLAEDFMDTLAAAKTTMLVSIHAAPMYQEEAVHIARMQVLESVDKSMAYTDIKSEKKPEDKNQNEEAWPESTSGDESRKNVLLTVICTIFADTYDELENITKEIRTKAEHSLYELPTTVGQQEGGFASCVPLGVNRVQTDCMLPTKEAVLFIPLPGYIQKNVKEVQLRNVNR
ncbi:MAG: hypothetical protein ACLTXE_03775 [Enterocloster aldenensis]